MTVGFVPQHCFVSDFGSFTRGLSISSIRNHGKSRDTVLVYLYQKLLVCSESEINQGNHISFSVGFLQRQSWDLCADPAHCCWRLLTVGMKFFESPLSWRIEILKVEFQVAVSNYSCVRLVLSLGLWPVLDLNWSSAQDFQCQSAVLNLSRPPHRGFQLISWRVYT